MIDLAQVVKDPHRGMHLIAGRWLDGPARFNNQPTSGNAREFATGSPELIDQAVQSAEDAFASYGSLSREQRAVFLEGIAEEIETRANEITHAAMVETGLPEARLEGERGRTTSQLRMFSRHIRSTDFLDIRHDTALPDRTPLPRPDLRMMQRPLGPVAVFGASNFPLAFSTAGGDTAAALAAGCPVVFKGHEAHPHTSEIVAEAILTAIEKSDMHPGVFSLVHGGSHTVGSALVQHPLIQAVGFTGSLGGGRALFDLCMSRTVPIPFFGELGSVNPVFLLPSALSVRGQAIAQDWAASLTLGAGQFCTNPGLVVGVGGADLDRFAETTAARLAASPDQLMLTQGLAENYRSKRDLLVQNPCVERLVTSNNAARESSADLAKVSARAWLENNSLHEEVFGPFGLIVEAAGEAELIDVANRLQGQLTATLQSDHEDYDLAAQLIPRLERKCGRILMNGFPTGVEVSDAMVHGGPYPASTNFGATSVGTFAIRRFLRPVCYQNIPSHLLPDELGDLRS